MNRLSYSILYIYTFLNANVAKMLAGLKWLEVRWYWASLYKNVIIARDPPKKRVLPIQLNNSKTLKELIGLGKRFLRIICSQIREGI